MQFLCGIDQLLRHLPWNKQCQGNRFRLAPQNIWSLRHCLLGTWGVPVSIHLCMTSSAGEFPGLSYIPISSRRDLPIFFCTQASEQTVRNDHVRFQVAWMKIEWGKGICSRCNPDETHRDWISLPHSQSGIDCGECAHTHNKTKRC